MTGVLDEFDGAFQGVGECVSSPLSLPPCTGIHYMKACESDDIAGALFVCYMGAKAGMLSDTDAAVASRALKQHRPVSVPIGKCLVDNTGLEFYRGSITDKKMKFGRGMARYDEIVNTGSWRVESGIADVAYSSQLLDNVPVTAYEYISASVGNFVGLVERGGQFETSKSPVVLRACRSGSSSWFEYIGRNGRYYRFREPSPGDGTGLLLSEGSIIGHRIVMDALHLEGAEGIDDSFSLTSRTGAVCYAMACAYKTAIGVGMKDDNLVAAVMPCVSHPRSMDAANSALLASCIRHLAAHCRSRRVGDA